MQLLYQTVQSVLNAGRLGSPVFARYVAQIEGEEGELREALAEALAVVTSWLGSPPQRVYVQGGVDSGQLTATVQYLRGQTALLSVGVAPGKTLPLELQHDSESAPSNTTPQIDLTLLGSKGALYHDGASLSPFALTAAGSIATTETPRISKPLMRAMEKSLRTGKAAIVGEVDECE